MTRINKKFFRAGSNILLPFVMILMLLFYNGCASGSYDSRRDTAGNDNSYNDNSYVNENDVLDQYGEWINVAQYGNVWRPFVGPDWQPYSYGHWIDTENGWTWVSYEPFGWITYHYGYWDYQPETGWFWIESNQWSPARVQWADYGDYIGWAPLPPPGYSLPEPGVYRQVHAWNIINARYFTQENVWKYRVSDQVELDNIRVRVARRQGPEVRVVERYTNQPISIVRTQRVKVNVNGRNFNRIVLPERERAVVRRYEPQINGTVVRTRNDQRTRENTGSRNNRRPDNSGQIAPPANPNGGVGNVQPRGNGRQKDRQDKPIDQRNNKPVDGTKAPGVETRTNTPPAASTPGATEQTRTPRRDTPSNTRNNGQRQRDNTQRQGNTKDKEKQKAANPEEKESKSKEAKTERETREDRR